ncbi:pyridoxal phosphate-dependent aminotransferase [Konateibacter massiliensis]|uniref:pyridoxal phosphate-dependent aminotransferase n=1 Tax=Konateibacter massiliensis TaxID=2002841 RepID=UPI000C15833F|nr:threonine-phosphate decarboxylase [Konateibacter massiliensis]
MIRHSDHFHGSDLEAIEAAYGIKKENITSFSANVNPLGVSPLLRKTLSDKIDAITSYPDREYTSLRKCIAAYAGCDYSQIIVGNGSTELISLFIQIKHPQKALILGPTYSEYEREISLGGGTSLYYPLKEEEGFKINVGDFLTHLHEGIDLLVICNPNNPTSTSVTNEQMRLILDHCKQHDIFVMIDETYVEFADNMEEIECVPLTLYYNNLIILRGISKFFAAPGLRLGYAISGNMDLIKEINKRKNPWTINSLAEVAGSIMFTDTEYIEQTKQLISSERERIYTLLSKREGLHAYQPTANFMLVKILRKNLTSHDLFDAAIRKNLMIRDCSTFPFLSNKFFRFCFMEPEKNDELIACILACLEQD